MYSRSSPGGAAMTEPRDAQLGDRADRIVASWALAIARRPRFVATMCVTLLVGISLGALRLRVAMSVEDLLLEHDPYRIAYNDLRADFPSDEAILVLVGADDVFAPEILRRLERFHHALESQLPYVQDVESLINARVTRADGDSLTVEGLFDEWPRDAAELAARREAALSSCTTLFSVAATWRAALSEASEERK